MWGYKHSDVKQRELGINHLFFREVSFLGLKLFKETLLMCPSRQGAASKKVVVLGGGGCLGGGGGSVPDHNFQSKNYHSLFLFPFDAEAFKTFKNTIKLCLIIGKKFKFWN